MTYCALLIPQTKNEKPQQNTGLFQSLTGKLMSGLNKGGLTFDNASTVLKNTASLISEGVDTIGNKFSGIALTQLLSQGKITSDTAFGYLTQGFPRALNLTSVALGFQSVEQLKTALRSRNGVNVQQFIKSFQNFGSALSDMAGLTSNRQNTDGFDVIEIDAVTNDTRSYQSETPDRRVESGQTYQEFVHNIPELLTLECYLQEGRRYTGDEFESIMLGLRRRKVAINIILGDDRKDSYILTNFSPSREPLGGYPYSLEFKHVQVGTVELVSLDIPKTKSVAVVKNELFNDDKTTQEITAGYKKPTAQSLLQTTIIGSILYDN